MTLKYHIIKYLVFWTIAMHTSMVLGQQPPQYTQYMYNTSVLNAAYTGSSSKLEATLLHRSQWVGLEGSPKIQSLSVEGKIRERAAVGININNDAIGASSNLKINANFAYHIPVGYYTKLALGVSGGLDILNIDWSKGTFEDRMDPLFQENLNKTRPIFGLGAFLYERNWYLGFSSPNFLNSQIYSDNDASVTDRKSQYYVMAGYVFDVSRSLKFKPSFLSKHVAGAPVTIDFSANFMIDEKVTLGAAYRYDDAISALIGLNLSRKFYVGYAYDYSIAGLRNFNDGSHEIILKYRVLGKKKIALAPRFF